MSVGDGSSERDWNQTELRERSKHCSSPPEPQTKAREPAGCQRTTTILDYREKRNTGDTVHVIHHYILHNFYLLLLCMRIEKCIKLNTRLTKQWILYMYVN
jgi:hypothetical protein